MIERLTMTVMSSSSPYLCCVIRPHDRPPISEERSAHQLCAIGQGRFRTNSGKSARVEVSLPGSLYLNPCPATGS